MQTLADLMRTISFNYTIELLWNLSNFLFLLKYFSPVK